MERKRQRKTAGGMDGEVGIKPCCPQNIRKGL